MKHQQITQKFRISDWLFVCSIAVILTYYGTHFFVKEFQDRKNNKSEVAVIVPEINYDIGKSGEYMNWNNIYYDKTKQTPKTKDGYIHFEDVK